MIGEASMANPVADGMVSKNASRIPLARDRKSTRLNSSHRCNSYAVVCLKKKTAIQGANLPNPHDPLPSFVPAASAASGKVLLERTWQAGTPAVSDTLFALTALALNSSSD